MGQQGCNALVGQYCNAWGAECAGPYRALGNQGKGRYLLYLPIFIPMHEFSLNEFPRSEKEKDSWHRGTVRTSPNA